MRKKISLGNAVKRNNSNKIKFDVVNFEESIQNALVVMDKRYRKLNGMIAIQSEDPFDYCAELVLTDVVDNNFEPVTDGLECGKCGKMTAVRGTSQKRSGDEGQSMILRCTNKSCGFEKLLSH